MAPPPVVRISILFACFDAQIVYLAVCVCVSTEFACLINFEGMANRTPQA